MWAFNTNRYCMRGERNKSGKWAINANVFGLRHVQVSEWVSDVICLKEC